MPSSPRPPSLFWRCRVFSAPALCTALLLLTWGSAGSTGAAPAAKATAEPKPTPKVEPEPVRKAAASDRIVAIDVTNLPDGEYKFTKKGGVVIDVRPLDLYVPGSPTAPPPTTPPGPLPTFQAEIQRLTKAALAKGGTETTGAGISSVYSLAADGLSANPPTLDVFVAADFVRRGTTTVVNAQKEQAAWLEFSTALDDTITTLRAKGDLKTNAQFAALFRDVAKGMDAATGYAGKPVGQGILGNIDIAKLIELIKLIMELFKLFSP